MQKLYSKYSTYLVAGHSSQVRNSSICSQFWPFLRNWSVMAVPILILDLWDFPSLLVIAVWLENYPLLSTRSCKSSVTSGTISYSMDQWHVTYLVYYRTVLNFRRIREIFTTQDGVTTSLAWRSHTAACEIPKSTTGMAAKSHYLPGRLWELPWFVEIIPVPPLPDWISGGQIHEKESKWKRICRQQR